MVRFLVDFSNKEDVRQVHALQDAIKFNQERPGSFEIRHWDEATLKTIKAALLQLGTTVSDTRRMFGANEHPVDPVKHLTVGDVPVDGFWSLTSTTARATSSRTRIISIR